jgi:hypothetical protein
VTPRPVLATLVYSTSLFLANGPRKFSVYIINPGYSYYKDFPQVRMYDDEISLNTLYNYS